MQKIYLKCLIIDDENLARRRLYDLIEKRSELSILSECKTGQQAILDIDNLKPDIIFLDIEMKDMTGFEVLKQIKHLPIVVFVTAYKNYAIKAFEYFAFDYLLKPFNKKRFDLAVDRIIEYKASLSSKEGKDKMQELLNHLQNIEQKQIKIPYKNRLSVKNGNEIVFVNYNDILYIKASGSYVELYTTNKSYVIRSSLTNIIGKYNVNFLLRIHRSTIINLNFIDKVIYSNYSEMDIKMKDGELFRVSKSYKKKVQQILAF